MNKLIFRFISQQNGGIAMIKFVIRGVVNEAETGVGISGLFVKAYDKDLLFDDLMGTAYTGDDGHFSISSQSGDFREFLDRNPDIYLKVYTPDEERLLYTSEDAVRWRAGEDEVFEVRIPREDLDDLLPRRRVQLLDDRGRERTDFDVGEALTVQIEGLQPATAHDVILQSEDGDELFTSRLMSNRDGVIEGAVLWPQFGLSDPRTDEALTVEQAQERWQGHRLNLAVGTGNQTAFEHEVRIADTFSRPLVLGTDEEGRVVNGFVVNEGSARVSGYNVPFEGRVRVYMVPRQRNWRMGDPFAPVHLVGGRPAFVDVEVEARRFQAVVAQSDELAPGAYDFIVRPLRYGYEDDEVFILRENDLVTRTVTGLVVREEFMASKTVLGGCVNTQPMSGRHISGRPYFQYVDTFQVGDDVWGALDPAALDPNLIGKAVALYVIQHKPPTAWSSDSSLTHLPVLGGNPAVLKFVTQPGCINYNDRLLWPNATIEGEYDLVADFGNDATSLSAFTPDDSFDPPLDLIDGYFVSGFRVVPDPTTDTSFANCGSFQYNDGPVTVTDDYDSVTVDRRAIVYFPSDVAGATMVSQISTAQSSYPVVVIVHGNSSVTTSYLGYNYLLEHLAKSGFIAASIHLNPGMHGTGRARMLFQHLTLLNAKFGSNAANNIGIMGHSRGGEAVAIAARLNHQDSLGHNINAVISLAPTDQYTSENLGGTWATPYLVVYGAMDGDVAGGSGNPWNTGFALYDRASGAKKSMVFVYGATHGRFNTVWGDTDLYFGKIGPTDMPKLISADAHQKVAKGYMTAFFRQNLKNETQWKGIFRDEWVPSAVELADGGAVKLYVQYEDTTRSEVDNFEEAHTATSWQTSTIGGAVTDSSTLPANPQENELFNLDNQSPHDTSGLLLRWDNTSDELRFNVPSAHQNVTAYNAVSFRITQKVGSASNPAGPQDLYLTLNDTTGNSRSIKVSKFQEIPQPQSRHYAQYTKSAMNTVRIPLHVFIIEVVGTDQVDLTKIESLTFDFGANGTGEVEIDSVEFTE
ncbi:hypothetical protein NC796_00155 [Aliifodinibius sp. S!AR15-10]|uniref:hypothetical protein n=1 Tax=Aliifodinibius sp. S!AR15-10 TaxID=2950437 RepID=UPI002858A894|nr:hypothetical protein [Aliifodinibius sp. S!AR15-10]MDR8389525.1 hypothetical protein [Aliifodinibius sp. S!AR15-10]